MRRPWVEPATCWWQVQRPNHYTNEPHYRRSAVYAMATLLRRPGVCWSQHIGPTLSGRKTDVMYVTYVVCTPWFGVDKKLSCRWQTARRICANGGADLLKTPPPHMCHHAEFGHFRSNRVRISSGEPAKLRFARDKPPWDGGRGWSKNKQLPMCVTTPNLVVLL